MKLSELKDKDITVVSSPQTQIQDFSVPNKSGVLKLSNIKADDIQQVQQPQDPTSGSTPSFLKPLGVLAVLPQIAQKGLATAITSKSRSKVAENEKSIGNIAQWFLSKAHSEENVVKKKQYLEGAQNAVNDLKKIGKNVDDLNKQILEANKINIPIPGIGGTIPAISNDVGRGIQQVVGRGIGTVSTAAPHILGPTLAGGTLGLGESMEQGKDIGETAQNVGLYALGGKLIDYGFGKVLGTQLGQRVLSSPVVSTIGNALNPLMATKAKTPAGIAVDEFAQAAGKFANKVLSPSSYIKPVGGALKVIGKGTGLLPNEQQELQSAHNKIKNYWDGVKNRYADIIRYDTNSPEVLGREGLIPVGKGNSMITDGTRAILKQKISGEARTFNTMLDSFKAYGSIDSWKRQAISNVNSNFKGAEREEAIKYLERQIQALLRDPSYASKIIVRDSGEQVIPLSDLNGIKSYLWGQGYASKLAPTSEKVSAEAARLMGNAAKNEIQSSIEQQAGEEAKDALINLNNRLGELYQADKFLHAVNGQKLPFGLIGRHFARVAGAVIGSQGGVAGSITGALTAEKIVDVLQDPKFSVGQAAAIIARARQETPEALVKAEEIIRQNIQRQAETLSLPAPRPLGSVGNPIITPAPTQFETQAPRINYNNSIRQNIQRQAEIKAPINELKDVYNTLTKAGMSKEKALAEIVPEDVIDAVKKGTIDPIIVDKKGNIIDGLHRALVGDVLGIEVPRVIEGQITRDINSVRISPTLNGKTEKIRDVLPPFRRKK